MSDDEKADGESPRAADGVKGPSFKPSGSVSREVKVEGKDHKVGVGDRKPKPEAPGAPPKSTEGTKATVGLKPVFEKQYVDDVWTSTSTGPDDKTYVEALSAKISGEALSGSIDAKKQTAKLTVAELKLEAKVAHGQIDLVEAIGELLFGKPESPPSVPDGPMTPLAARVTDLTAHGTPLLPGPGSPNVFIGSMPAIRANIDMFVCAAPGAAPHGAGPAQLGEPTVFINSMPAVRVGDFVMEPTGGPNVIVMGCPTVSIGSPAAAPTPAPKADDGEPWVIFESVAKGDVGSGEAELEAEADVDLKAKKGGASFKIGASAALAKAELPLKVRIRLPFTSAYLGLGVTATGTVGSVGAEAGGSVKVNETDAKTGKTKWFAGSVGAGAHAGLGGVGMKFSIDIAGR